MFQRNRNKLGLLTAMLAAGLVLLASGRPAMADETVEEEEQQQPSLTAPAESEQVEEENVESSPGRRERHRKGRYIGLVCRPADPVLRSQLGLAEGEGLVVHHVVPDSPAAAAGIRPHDVLAEVNGEPLKSLGQLAAAVRESSDGPLRLTLLRHGKREQVEVQPAERPRDLPGRRPPGPGPFDEEPDDAMADLWRRLFPRGQRGELPRDLTFLLPGPPRKVEFPNDLHISIDKQGNEPARITVEKGDERWEATEDDLRELPDEIRGYVAAVLGRVPERAMQAGERVRRSISPYLDRLPEEGRHVYEGMLRRLEEASERAREAAERAHEEDLDRVNRRLERLQKMIESLEKRLSERLGSQPSADEPDQDESSTSDEANE